MKYEYFKVAFSVYLLAVVGCHYVTMSALLNPTVKSLVPLIICSTSLIVAVVVTKND